MPAELVTVGLVCADVKVRPVESLPQPGTLALVNQLELHLGGLAGVTAAAYARLGGTVAFIGCVGQDGFGDYLLATLSRLGVDTSACVRSATLGTSATVVTIREDGERTFMHYAGATGELTPEKVDLEVLRNARVVHWGGPAVTPGLEGEAAARLFAAAHEFGVQTSLDTCYDGAGRWLARIEAALPHTDLVFTSIEEGRHYAGRDTAEGVADFFQERGAKSVVVKLGSEGLYAIQEETRLHIPAHQVEVVDTTGAGDAACAGYLYGHIAGWDFERCARMANAVGALNVRALGGPEAMGGLDDALALMQEGITA
jgi:sugar/nucleoside kinase (ribokinase family)